MNKSEYAEYLRTSHWREVRDRFCAVPANQQCSVCGTPNNLDLHHLTYERLGHEELTDLVRLCHKCHFTAHELLEASGACKCIAHFTQVLSDMRAALSVSKRQEHVVFISSRLGHQVAGGDGP